MAYAGGSIWIELDSTDLVQLKTMSTIVNIHEAKTHLSRLVDQAAQGQEFVIAKAGKPMVRLVPLHPPGEQRTLGFMAGRGVMQADVKQDFQAEIDAMFGQRT